MAQRRRHRLARRVSLSQALPAGVAQALMAAAKTALFRLIAWCWRRRVLLLLLAAGIWRSLATVAKPQSAL